MIIKYKYGFWYKDWLFVWHNKQLFRYPISKNKRAYSLKKVFIDTERSSRENYYRCATDWLPEKRIKAMTVSINIDALEFTEDDDLPF